MALFTGGAAALISVASEGLQRPTGLIAGEHLKAGAFCYVKSDGLVYECLGTSGSAASAPDGVAGEERQINQSVALWGEGTVLRYADSDNYMTPGAMYYLSAAAAGYLDSAATAGDKKGVAKAISKTMLLVTRADGVKWFTNSVP